MKLYRIVRGTVDLAVGSSVRANTVEEALRKDYAEQKRSVDGYNRRVGGATVAPVLRVYEMVEVEFKQ